MTARAIEAAKLAGRYDAQDSYSTATAADMPHDVSYLTGPSQVWEVPQ